MDKDALREALGVIYNMVQKNEDYEFHTVEADYDVQRHTRITDAADIKRIAAGEGVMGRGGTSFKIPIEWTMENVKPDIIVYCTDDTSNSASDLVLYTNWGAATIRVRQGNPNSSEITMAVR